jgi:predicted dehydrogenase
VPPRHFVDGVRELGESCPLWTVGFNRRFAPAARAAREFLAGIQAPLTLSYRFNAGPIPRDHWTQDPEVGGGRLIGEACHALDLACYLIGSRVARVFAESVAPGGSADFGDDQSVIVARFEDGSVASICYFAGGDKSFPKERIEVFGGNAVAVIDDFKGVTLARGGVSRNPKLVGRDKGHAAELEAFVAAVRQGGPPPIPYEDLLNVTEAAIAAVYSLRAGVPVPLGARSEDREGDRT